MLFGQMQGPNQQAQQVGFLIGVILAVVVSGAIPLTAGLIAGGSLRSNKRAGSRPMVCIILGIAGGLLAGGTAVLIGCLGGLPVAILFTIPIIVVATTAPKKGKGRRRREYDDVEDDYDDRPRRRRRDEDEDDEFDDRPRRRRRDLDD